MRSIRFSVMKAIPALVLALALINSHAAASVIGTVNVANSAGGGITLTSTSVDFLLPAAGGNGAMTTGVGTALSYSGGGPLVSATTGLVLDLPTLAGSTIDFMTFAGHPLLHFDLTAIGPGVVNTVAASTFDPNTPPSSPSVGSPFILQATATGTVLSFSVSGIARDNSSPDSLWSGLFTTQFAAVTPLQVQQVLLGSGSISSTYSASINASGAIPEPATASLLLVGLVPLLQRRRSV